eukprot:scaffold9578_cov42-Phaeocystis_antarctica.AAC.1
MIFRSAPAALAVLAAFNVASSLASPVTWAQHARGGPLRTRVYRAAQQLACIAVPRPIATAWLGLGLGLG